MLIGFPLRVAAVFSVGCRRHLLAGALGVAAVVGASPASAQVMEIGEDGTVSVRTGAGAANFEVVTPASDKVVDEAGAPVVPAFAFTAVGPAPVPPQYAGVLMQAAAAANVSPTLLSALVWQESRWPPRAPWASPS